VFAPAVAVLSILRHCRPANGLTLSRANPHAEEWQITTHAARVGVGCSVELCGALKLACDGRPHLDWSDLCSEMRKRKQGLTSERYARQDSLNSLGRH
jgi:hypothetical protein